jgi:hypothetical protein
MGIMSGGVLVLRLSGGCASSGVPGVLFLVGSVSPAVPVLLRGACGGVLGGRGVVRCRFAEPGAGCCVVSWSVVSLVSRYSECRLRLFLCRAGPDGALCGV